MKLMAIGFFLLWIAVVMLAVRVFKTCDDEIHRPYDDIRSQEER